LKKIEKGQIFIEDKALFVEINCIEQCTFVFFLKLLLDKVLKNTLKKLYNPFYLQFIFWFILFYFEFNRLLVYTNSYHVYLLAFLRVGIYAAVINFNVFFLIPRVFYKKHYILYIITILTIAFTTAALLGKLEICVFYDAPEAVNNLPEHIQLLIHFMKILPLMGFLFFTTVYTLGKRKDEKMKIHAREKITTELRLLQNQINPHFLYNALNSVYSLSYIKSELTPQMILKLSEMLRYVLYECSEDSVTLEKELIYLENYITFQNLKEETDKLVSVDFGNTDKTKLIAPMLFIPFIENSFKHSNISTSDKAFINIKMTTTENRLNFEIENTCTDSAKSDKYSKGIGLKNVKRRLKLIYQNRHSLEIDSSSNTFKVKLTLELI